MAEGLIGGVIGDEEESSEAEADALAGADAFAAATNTAISMGQSRNCSKPIGADRTGLTRSRPGVTY
jgi:hypothetical protein